MKSKKYFCAAAALAAAVSLLPPPIFVYAETVTTETAADEAAESSLIFDSDEKSLQFDGAAIVNDYAGAASVVFSFTYTNKTSEGQMPLTEYFVTVYQDGVSLQSTALLDANYTNLVSAAMTTAKDGGSVPYAVAYKLNSTSDLELEISDSVAGENKKTFNIPLTQTETETETGDVDWEEKYNELSAQYEELSQKYAELEAKYNELSAATE